MRSTSDIVAAIGLAIGGALGMAGTFVGSDALRETLWTIDGVGIVVATALLTMKYQRLGNDLVAAGFLTFLAGESLLLAGNAAGLQASVPSMPVALRSGRRGWSWSARKGPSHCGRGSRLSSPPRSSPSRP